MDYGRVYKEFIADRRLRPRPQGYTERHHILPRALGGGDEPENLIDLTAEDHIFAHLLLAKAHGGKMWFPLTIMLRPARQLGIDCKGGRARRIAAIAKREQSRRQSGRKRPDVSAAMRGRKFSDEHRAAISRAATGRKDSEETRQKKSRASAGRVFTAERNAKVSASKVGDSNPAKRPDVRAKIAAKAKINSAGKNNPRFNSTVYRFRHNDGREVAATKFDMAAAHNLNRTCLNYVVSGKRKQTKGWALAS
jgi:hypothetical protein